MIYTSGPLPTITAQLIDYQRAAATQSQPQDGMTSRGKKIKETSAANGKKSRKAIVQAVKKLGTANAAVLASKTGLCKESIRRHCRDLVEAGLLTIKPTRPMSWSPKASNEKSEGPRGFSRGPSSTDLLEG